MCFFKTTIGQFIIVRFLNSQTASKLQYQGGYGYWAQANSVSEQRPLVLQGDATTRSKQGLGWNISVCQFLYFWSAAKQKKKKKFTTEQPNWPNSATRPIILSCWINVLQAGFPSGKRPLSSARELRRNFAEAPLQDIISLLRPNPNQTELMTAPVWRHRGRTGQILNQCVADWVGPAAEEEDEHLDRKGIMSDYAGLLKRLPLCCALGFHLGEE